VTTRIYNDSDTETLASADYRLLIADCSARKAEMPCTTVQDQKGTFHVEVPPKEARDVAIVVHGDQPWQPQVTSILGTPRVEIQITSARAK
jgi:hypothetical protein